MRCEVSSGVRRGRRQNPLRRLPDSRARRSCPFLRLKMACSSTCRVSRPLDFTGRSSGHLVLQKLATGHLMQEGFLAEQKVWPSSIIAELWSLGCWRSKSSSAHCQSCRSPEVELTGSWKSKRRLSTRAMLASTIGAGRSKENEETAPAVYFPIPGSCSRVDASFGKWPP